MSQSTESIIRETLDASNQGRIHFGQVISHLLQAGVESYHVDYRSARATYYMPSDETLTLDLDMPQIQINQNFNSAGIKAAILGAQRGEVMYPEFKQLSQQAGCIGYTVWIAGRHVTYYGRNGEQHIEHFPSTSS
jgi:uncharacterized protein YbcV (DUF1398 family)